MIPYDPSHPDTLAVYCSDGRFTRAVEALAEQEGHHRLDTLTIPGGPGLFDAWTANSFSESEILIRAASFLIANHHIKVVYLVAHEGCGFYRERFGEANRVRQCTDMRKAAQHLLMRHENLVIKSRYAVVVGNTVTFEDVTSHV